MKSEIKKLPKSQVEITITVPYADYEKAEKKAIETLSKEIKVPGFRSGHIPEEKVREEVDKQAIYGVALEHLIPDTYIKAVKEHDVHIIAQPKVDVKTHVKKSGDQLVYTATVSVMPEVKMGDYNKIKVTKPKVEKDQVDETVQMIVDRFAEWKDVKRVAKKGDRVEINFEGFDEKGVAIPNTQSKNHPVILGSKIMVPGFEEAVEGMEIGNYKEFDITFPKEYHSKEMQGKKIKFKVSLNKLEEKKDIKLDEALIEKITGQKQSVEDFKKRVEDDLLAEMKTRMEREHDNKVIQEIIKITKIELPDIMVDEEVEYLKKDQQERVKQQGLTWEQYLAHIKKTDEDFAKEHKKAAEDRLLARLGVLFILKDAKIEISDDQIDARLKEMSEGYPKEYQAKFLEYYAKDSDGYRTIKNNMAADKLIEMLSK
jgi:trigger factor